MQQEFGIVLKAVTDKFQAKMNQIQSVGEKLKQRFETGWNIDVKAETSRLEELKKKLQGMTPDIELQFDKNGNLTVAENQLSQFKSALSNLGTTGKASFSRIQEDIKAITADLNQVKGDRLSKLGNIFRKIKDTATMAGGKVKDFANKVKDARNSSKGISGTGIKKMGDEFGNAVKKVKKFALALLSIRSIYSLLSRASQAYLSFDQDLSDRLQSVWAGLGAQLAPVIEFIVNLLAKAVAYVNAFVKALTGINMVARANTKALNKQAGATKNASKSLSSMDEITSIQKDTGGGGGGAETPQIELPDIDTGKLEGALKRIKEIASTLFKPIKNAWDKYGGQVINSAKNMMSELWGLTKEVGKSFAEVWTNGTGEKYVGLVLQMWRDVFDIIGGIAGALKNAWSEENTGTQIIQHIADIFITIQQFANSIIESLKQWVLSESFQNAISTVLKVVKDLLGYISNIASWIVDMYKKYLKPVVDEVLGLITDLINLIGAIWDIAKPVVDRIVSTIKTYLSPVIQMVGGALQTVISIIRLIVQVVTGKLKGNWTSVWNSMKNTAKSVVNGLIGFMNGWIRGLNNMLKPLRKVIVAIAQAFGKNVSMNDIAIPTIPKLATGTNYVPEDQLAYIHKGEAVVPKKFNSAEYFSNINNNEETNALLLEVNRTLIEIREKDTTLNVNGKELARATYNDFKQEGNRLGQSSIVSVR